jgi:type II secretory pathway pseudopilin PulG
VKKQGIRINTFLVEIVVVILFFALSATVTLQLFVAAHNRQRESSEISAAMLQAQSLVEQFRAGETMDATLYFDEDWNPVMGSGKYEVALRVNPEERAAGQMLVANVRVVRSAADGTEKEIYGLTAKKYVPAF